MSPFRKVECPPRRTDTEEERDEDETLHRVTIKQGFYLGVHEVTQAQWRAVDE